MNRAQRREETRQALRDQITYLDMTPAQIEATKGAIVPGAIVKITGVGRDSAGHIVNMCASGAEIPFTVREVPNVMD
jgi:hypothetical protein